MITVLYTLVGVALLGVVAAEKSTDQSDITIPNDEEPIEFLENGGRQRRKETPEVVLQLKYDKGGLNRIYLAQFHKEKQSWLPSVSDRQSLCTDLCHAGLGGDACGGPCAAMLPVGLQQALTSTNSTDSVFGEPRVDVCPTLCHNHLGYPLCNCEETSSLVGAEVNADEEDSTADWDAVCAAFCHPDSYVLAGCPSCAQQPPTPLVAGAGSRVLNTVAGWSAWCDLQCRQGHGGAACNCDRAPF